MHSWRELVSKAHGSNVHMQVVCEHHTSLPQQSKAYDYFVWAAACAQVEMDVLTGAHVVQQVDIVFDAGLSTSPIIDMGQLEGAFIMGLGQLCSHAGLMKRHFFFVCSCLLCVSILFARVSASGHFTCEETIQDPVDGGPLSRGSWNYLIPSSRDIPVRFHVSMLPGVPNAKGVLQTKATGEPALMLAASVFLALRECVQAAASDCVVKGSTTAGNTGPGVDFVTIDAPASAPRLAHASRQAAQRILAGQAPAS